MTLELVIFSGGRCFERPIDYYVGFDASAFNAHTLPALVRNLRVWTGSAWEGRP